MSELSSQVIRHISSFLNTLDLIQFSKVSSTHRRLFTNDLADRKVISEHLLPHVFIGDADKLGEFLRNSKLTVLDLILNELHSDRGAEWKILKKTCFPKGFFSLAFKRSIHSKTCQNISVIQAAALCHGGDSSLVRMLLSYLRHSDELKEKASKQLQEVLEPYRRHEKSFALAHCLRSMKLPKNVVTQLPKGVAVHILTFLDDSRPLAEQVIIEVDHHHEVDLRHKRFKAYK